METLMTINTMLDAMVTGMLRGFAISITVIMIWQFLKWIWKKLRQVYRRLFKHKH